MADLCDMSAVDLRRLIGRGDISPVELLDSCLARIARINPAVNAVVALDTERARAAAQSAEAAVRAGEPLGPLHGIPVGIKDTEDTAGLRTTYGSPIHADNVPARDLGVVARLRGAGAIVLAKTNTPEFAAGANTRNTVYGATGNAFDPTLSAAGSSGGSAVALACGMVPLASGSDTGGSLRNPAAYAGIVGMRPSSGLVPNERRGLGWANLPVNGPMARTVGDAALMLGVMADDDPRDPLAYTLPGEPVRGRADRYHPPQAIDLGTLRVAFTEDFGFAPTEQHVRRIFRRRVASLSPLFGATETATPDCTGADEAFAILRAAQFLALHLDTYRTRPQRLGPNVRTNVEEGLGYALADYARAASLQTMIYRNFVDFFARFDLLISPTITLSPRPWSELYPTEIDGAATRSYFHWLALAYGVTLAGHPAISLPLGVDEAGLPFGVQVVARRGGDAALLAAAAAIEARCAGQPDLIRPTPDLAGLADRAPIAQSPGFLDLG
ncbi:amidase [Methylobacterium oryzae]|uniref:Amidase n=1 Tax=Methylobacterium oryzae TaxID=334852 RepID=A0ABU7TX90_9HYPH